MDPITAGLLIGGTTAALKAGAKGAGMIAERRSIGGKAARQELKKDVAKMRKGKLGMTAAQKRGAMAEAVKGIQAATRGSEAQLRREAAATGGFGRSGVQAQQLQELTQQRTAAAGQAAAGVEKASQEQAHRQRASILARAEEQGRKVKKDVTELAGGIAEGAEAGLKAGMEADYQRKLTGALDSAAAGDPHAKSAINTMTIE